MHGSFLWLVNNPERQTEKDVPTEYSIPMNAK